MLQIRSLSKRYGSTVAVDDLSFEVKPGRVTGFLGPNGAGKSTTMRMLLGLDRPTAGEALVNGRHYAELRRPIHEVGALLDANAVHPGRNAYDHLSWQAASNHIDRRRVVTCIEQVGLAGVARKPVGEFSLGMKQWLGIAGALLGDPGVLMFDEPVNGLDPEGVRWIRELLKGFANEGRTVLLSSHLMSEMAQTADDLVILGRGRLVAETTVQDLADRFVQGVFVRSPRPGELAQLLRSAGYEVDDGDSLVRGATAEEVGDLAAGQGIPIHQLVTRSASLEDAYLELTADSVEYRAGGPSDD
ncbi:ABC transporter ATP-binding protein [Tenggerimyces flavus]|uniref:ABC transporter ATP-binding protein n=1 Tax=Tenggerimyces flavus TaxID=1708749 RepID=A0ABV7YJK8_9ACTN|nr:ATP-binding cassette domain-containing protein [Tenggerimyces flavus]MBM7784053.1 ABC-2 type transport system ATP-binding protein [Tenggerimyces flavus]